MVTAGDGGLELWDKRRRSALLAATCPYSHQLKSARFLPQSPHLFLIAHSEGVHIWDIRSHPEYDNVLDFAQSVNIPNMIEPLSQPEEEDLDEGNLSFILPSFPLTRIVTHSSLVVEVWEHVPKCKQKKRKEKDAYSRNEEDDESKETESSSFGMWGFGSWSSSFSSSASLSQGSSSDSSQSDEENETRSTHVRSKFIQLNPGYYVSN